MLHCYDTDVAEKYGIEEAVLIHILSDMVVHDGVWKGDGNYVRCGFEKMLHLVPEFRSTDKVKRVVNKLAKHKIIIKANFNDDNTDRTGWYTVDTDNL